MRFDRRVEVGLVALLLVLILGSCSSSLSPPASAPLSQSSTPVVSQQTLSAVKPALTETSPSPAPAGAFSTTNEKRLLVLDWPESIRVGEGDFIFLTLEVDQNGVLTPTAQIAGHAVSGTPLELPNLYETHSLVVETRLDMAGLDIAPQGTMSEALHPGQIAQFAWSIIPNETGIYRGMLWLYLNIVPKSGGELDRRMLLARQMEIEAVNVLGLPVKVMRWTGILGTVTSAILGVPFLQDGLFWVWKRYGRKRDRKPD